MLKNLRLLRVRAGLSQKQLAEIINVSQQSINKYENHEVEPTLETLGVIADYFDTSIDFLVGRTELESKIEEVHELDLNAEEAKLITNYRALSKKEKNSVQLLAESLIEK
ncbi:MAG: helix-turn-helix transcriptional regulator [Clostridia bacterium]|nr:helix-turn-helix transcriptional regulator [Clostridia bacterium]